jgi:hypothetical protein
MKDTTLRGSFCYPIYSWPRVIGLIGDAKRLLTLQADVVATDRGEDKSDQHVVHGFNGRIGTICVCAGKPNCNNFTALSIMLLLRPRLRQLRQKKLGA